MFVTFGTIIKFFRDVCRRRSVEVVCPNEDCRFEEDCLVSLAVFDRGDSVTMSSGCLSSAAEVPHHYGVRICCRVHVERGKRRPFSESPLTVQLVTVEFSDDLSGILCYRS